MNIFRKYKNLWMMGIVIVVAILFIVNFSYVVAGVNMIWNSITGLLMGAMLAFVLNLIMDPTETFLKKQDKHFLSSHARPLALTFSLLVSLLIIALLLWIIIPNMINAVDVLSKEAPRYFSELEAFIKSLLQKFPILASSSDNVDGDWSDTVSKIMDFISKGFNGILGSTFNVVTSAVGGAVNLFVIVVFAIYVLSDKERFVKLYYFFTALYLPQEKTAHLTRNLHIINDSFRAFVGGEIIEACILTTMCSIGMMILQLPYALMIGVLVGVINMIPMVGAFIGGGIGAFIIFTISPVKCLVFLIFLCVIQQIESNVFFPRIIGNRVGLPGIYVMMTIVVGGSLFGVLGMILGVPFMASLYKIGKLYLAEKWQVKTGDQCPVNLDDIEEQERDEDSLIFKKDGISSKGQSCKRPGTQKPQKAESDGGPLDINRFIEGLEKISTKAENALRNAGKGDKNQS